MSNIKTPVIGLVAIVGIAYLAAKGYVYFQTKNKVDEIVKQASVFADVTYDGISSDLLKGSVSVNDIAIAPRTLQDVIQIREVKMQGDGPMFLFSDTSKYAQQLPEFLAVSMNGLRLGLDGEIYNSFNAMAAAQAKANNIELPSTCEFGGSLQAEDLRALGYDAMLANASFSVNNDKIASKTKMSVEMAIEDMGDFSMTTSMRGDGSPMMMAMAPAIDEIRFVYSVDPEYMKGLKKYCSDVLKISEEEYVNSLVKASDEDYQKYYGFIPGEGIREAIRAFIVSPGEVDIRMRPSPDINPATLQQYRPQDMVSLLGMTVYVNKQPVQDLSFILDEQYNDFFGGNAANADEKAEEKKKNIARYEYQKTAINRLTQYIGAKVKVSTSDGLERNGTLVSVNRKTAQIEQRIHSGKFAVHVPIEKISRLEVYRLYQEKVPAE